LLVFDIDGKNLTSLAKWDGKSLKGIAALAIDRRGFLACWIMERGEILRIPFSDIADKE
jgi:hypothetical protein